MQQSLIFKTVGTLRRLADLPTLRHISASEALCGGIVCTTPAVLAAYLHNPLLCWSAIAAFWSYLSIPSGKLTTRWVTSLTFGMTGAILSGLGVWTASYPILSVGLAAIMGFGGALLQASNVRVGFPALLAATAFAVSTTFPGKDFTHSVTYSSYFLYGNLWAVIFTLLLWPTRKNCPASRAVTSCFVELSNFMRSIANKNERTLTLTRTKTRNHLDNTQQTIRALGLDSGQTQRLSSLLFIAQSLFDLLVGLEHLIRHDQNSILPDQLLRITRQIMGDLSDATQCLAFNVRSSTPYRQVTLLKKLNQLDNTIARLYAFRKKNTCSKSTNDTIGELVTNARHQLNEAYKGSRRSADIAPLNVFDTTENEQYLFQEVKKNRPSKSEVFLHSLRVALATAISVGIVRVWSLDHGYWMILTVLLIIQPQFSGTLKTSVERVGGTLIGGMIAIFLSFFISSPLLLATLILPLSIGTLAGRFVNYFSYMLFLTPQFILVAQLSQPNGSELELTYLRVLNSFGGALLAICIFAIIPSRPQHQNLNTTISNAIKATKIYLQRSLKSNERTYNSRRTACFAIDQIEDLLEHIRHEPHVECQKLSGALTVAWALRDMVGVVTLLPLSTHNAHAQLDSERLEGFAHWADWEMDRIAAMLHGVVPDEYIAFLINTSSPFSSELISYVLDRLAANLALIAIICNQNKEVHP